MQPTLNADEILRLPLLEKTSVTHDTRLLRCCALSRAPARQGHSRARALHRHCEQTQIPPGGGAGRIFGTSTAVS